METREPNPAGEAESQASVNPAPAPGMYFQAPVPQRHRSDSNPFDRIKKAHDQIDSDIKTDALGLQIPPKAPFPLATPPTQGEPNEIELTLDQNERRSGRLHQ